MIIKSKNPRTGTATRKTIASSALIEKDSTSAAIIITGALHAGRMPVDTEFWIVVTSLVSLVTSEDVLNLSVFANENSCSFWYSAFLSSAPRPCPARAAYFALPVPNIIARTAQNTISAPCWKMYCLSLFATPTSTRSAIMNGTSSSSTTSMPMQRPAMYASFLYLPI